MFKCGICGREVGGDLWDWCKECERSPIPECAWHAWKVVNICTFCKEMKEGIQPERTIVDPVILFKMANLFWARGEGNE